MASLPNQTYFATGKTYFALAGQGGGGGTSTFTTASISSLTVSSINGVQVEDLDPGFWSAFPAIQDVDMASFALSSLRAIETSSTLVLQAPSTLVTGELRVAGALQAPSFATSSIVASTITANEIVALSTIHAISTISTTTASIHEITNLSSINGSNIDVMQPSQWSLYPAVSSINMSGFDVLNANDVYANALWATNASTNTQIYNANAGENFAFMVQRSFNPGPFDTQTFVLTGGSANGFGIVHLLNNSTIGQMNIRNGGIAFYDSNLNNEYLMSNGFWTSTINCSSINGAEFTLNGITTSTIVTDLVSSANGTFSNLATNGFSTIGASIQQGLMSSIVFNPSLGGINIDLGLGQFGGALIGTLGAGIFGALVAVPVTAGTITYGLTKGLASLFEPRPINNINSNVFETYNYNTQLQVSTLGEQISTVYRFISTIPSTIQINADPTFSTVSETNVEIYISTISSNAPVTCVRSIGDPVQTASTPWTYQQSFGQWVPIPEGGINSNVSTLTLSTLQLGPSTILSGLDLPGGVFTVFEAPATGALGQVLAQGITCGGTYGGSNGTYLYNPSLDRPLFLDNGAVSHTLAYTTDIPAYNPTPVVSTLTAQFSVDAGSVSTGLIKASGINSDGSITSYNALSAVQTPPAVGSAFAQLVTGLDAPGDASFYGVTSNAVGWGKFRVNPAGNVDVINAVAGIQQCLLNVGSNGAINLYDPASNVMSFSTNSLWVQNINGSAYPPTATLPANATFSTVTASTIGTGFINASSITNTFVLNGADAYFKGQVGVQPSYFSAGGVALSVAGTLQSNAGQVAVTGYGTGSAMMLMNAYDGVIGGVLQVENNGTDITRLYIGSNGTGMVLVDSNASEYRFADDTFTCGVISTTSLNAYTDMATSTLTVSTINTIPYAPTKSAFTSTILWQNISTTSHVVASTLFVVDTPSYVLGQANTTIKNTTNQYHNSYAYLALDGATSPSTVTTLINDNNSFSGQSISFRTALSTGTYTATLNIYGDTNGDLQVAQCDLFCLTNLLG